MQHSHSPQNRPSLVGGLNPSENISQLRWLFPTYGKIKVMFQTTNQIQFGVRQTNRNPRRTTLKKHKNQRMKTCWNSCWSFPSCQANNDREDLSGTNTRQRCDAQKDHHHSITSAWIDSCPSLTWKIPFNTNKSRIPEWRNQLQSTAINYKPGSLGGTVNHPEWKV